MEGERERGEQWRDSLFIYYKQTEHEIANVGRVVSCAKVPSNPKFCGQSGGGGRGHMQADEPTE